MGDTVTTAKNKETVDDSEPATYRDWLDGVLGELNITPSDTSGGGSSGTAKPAARMAPRGKGMKGGPIGKSLRNELFGDPASRTTVDSDIRGRIDEQVALGKAAPVSIVGGGGNELRGNFFSHADHNLIQNGKPDTTKPVVLFLSGSGEPAENFGTDIAEFYQGSGASMLSVNYGGYGEYAKDTPIPEPTEESILQDAQAMLQHLLDQGYTSDQIVIHGYSLGGAIAGKLQAHNEAPTGGGEEPGAFRGLVMDRPMLSSTAGVKGNIDNKAKALIGAALTRKFVGSMSARKAIKASDSATPIVLTTEGETKPDGTGGTKPNTFSITARKLREKMSGGPDREVTGRTGTGNHGNHADMLTTNGDLLKGLIGGGQEAPTQLGESGPKPADAKRTRDLVTAEIDKHQVNLNKLSAQSKSLANKVKADGDDAAAAKQQLQTLVDAATDSMDQLCEIRDALDGRAEPVLQRGVIKAIERAVQVIGAATFPVKEAGLALPIPDAVRDTMLNRLATQTTICRDFVASIDELKTDRAFGALTVRLKNELNELQNRVGDLTMVSSGWAGSRGSEVTDFRKAKAQVTLAISQYEASPPPAPRKPSGLRGVLGRLKRPGQTADTGART